MAYKIVAEECTSCGACELDCPNGAISEDLDKFTFVIDSETCTKCEGHHKSPKCVELCPIPDCVVRLAA